VTKKYLCLGTAPAYSEDGDLYFYLGDSNSVLSADPMRKRATGNSGKMMLEGESHSMADLYRTMPSFVPRPHVWGKFQISNPEMDFFPVGVL
jgi:hypothetical protein